VSSESNKGEAVFHANDIANYVVCQEAWRLKTLEADPASFLGARSDTQARRREAWFSSVDRWSQFTEYSRVIFVLLVFLAMVVFLFESQLASDPDFLKRFIREK